MKEEEDGGIRKIVGRQRRGRVKEKGGGGGDQFTQRRHLTATIDGRQWDDSVRSGRRLFAVACFGRDK